MPTVLVTGANRGIGLEFCREYAAAGWKVLAACRRPEAADALKALKGDVSVHQLDVVDDASIAALDRKLTGKPAIDVLINNAGVSETGVGAFGQLNARAWLDVFHVNAIGPLKVTESLADNVAASGQKKVIAISSRLGSIAYNDSGGRYAYRSSKSALNMAFKSLSFDLKPRGVTCAVFHPGWVKTDMGGPQAPVTPPQSVEGMIRKIAALTLDDTGKFFNFTGEEIPW